MTRSRDDERIVEHSDPDVMPMDTGCLHYDLEASLELVDIDSRHMGRIKTAMHWIGK